MPTGVLQKMQTSSGFGPLVHAIVPLRLLHAVHGHCACNECRSATSPRRTYRLAVRRSRRRDCSVKVTAVLVVAPQVWWRRRQLRPAASASGAANGTGAGRTSVYVSVAAEPRWAAALPIVTAGRAIRVRPDQCAVCSRSSDYMAGTSREASAILCAHAADGSDRSWCGVPSREGTGAVRTHSSSPHLNAMCTAPGQVATCR